MPMVTIVTKITIVKWLQLLHCKVTIIKRVMIATICYNGYNAMVTIVA